MTKYPHIRINLQLYAKDLPDHYRGLTSENWTFNGAAGAKMDLDELVVAMAMKVVLFYGNTVGFSSGEDVGAIEKKMVRAGEAIAARYLKEVPDD
jgi:hypothetical protein